MRLARVGSAGLAKHGFDKRPEGPIEETKNVTQCFSVSHPLYLKYLLSVASSLASSPILCTPPLPHPCWERDGRRFTGGRCCKVLCLEQLQRVCPEGTEALAPSNYQRHSIELLAHRLKLEFLLGPLDHSTKVKTKRHVFNSTNASPSTIKNSVTVQRNFRLLLHLFSLDTCS